jgi:hypothetical protein
VEPIVSEFVRLRFARLMAQRNAYRTQRDDLAGAIDRFLRSQAGLDGAEGDLSEAYRRVMGQDPVERVKRSA